MRSGKSLSILLAVILMFTVFAGVSSASPIGGGGGGGTSYYSGTLHVSESGLSSEITYWMTDYTSSTAPGSTASATVQWPTTDGTSVSYGISWDSVPGYTTPGAQTFTLSNGGSASVSGTYSANPGPLAPSFGPSASVDPIDSGQSTTLYSGINTNDVNGAYYSWSSPQGSFSSSTSSSPTFSDTVGSTQAFTITVSGGTDAGSASGSFTMTVNPDPTISISGPSTAGVGVSTSFTSSAAGGTGSYSFDWYVEPSGGSYSSFSTSQDSSYSFSSSGTYYLYATVKDQAGYTSSSNTITVTVYGSPTVSAVSSENPMDAGQSASISSTVSGGSGGGTYTWYDQSGQIGSGSVLSLSSFSAGTYQIYLNYTDSIGNSGNSGTISEVINPDPAAGISSSGASTDTGRPVEFSSSVSGGTPGYSYAWSIDGNSYTTQDVNVSFQSSGTYIVQLSVTDSVGYTATATYSETVNSAPTVTASSSVSAADVGYPVTFSCSPSGGTGGYAYSWTLNGNQLSTAQDFSYSFSSPGSYTLTITVTDAVSDTSSASASVAVNANPSVQVSSSQDPTDVGNSVTFSSTVSGGTGTMTYLWTVDGSQASTSASFPYSFSSSGTYYVNLTVTDGDSHTAATSFQEVVNPDPSVTIHAVHNPTDAGVWANFSALPTGGTGSYTYSWSINGNSFTAPYVNYTFTAAGTFQASLTVTDSVGNQASFTLNEVVNPDPSVEAQATYSTVDQGINDTLHAVVHGGVSGFNYTWTLGRNVLNYSEDFHLNFSSTGTYEINLTVTDSLGMTSASSIVIEVIQRPSAMIIGSNVTDLSTSTYWEGYGSYGTAPYEYYWLINGVNTSSGLYLQYSFPKAGQYNVTLIIVDSQEARAYAYLTLTVVDLPVVSVSESRSATDAGMPVYFNSSVTGGSPFFNYTWSISGIGFVGYQYDLVYSFAAGTYNVTVIVSDGSGNTASGSIEVVVNALPSVSIGVQYPNVDPGIADAFSAGVSGGTPGYSYAWYINGTLKGSGSSLDYAFLEPGVYPVRIVVTDSQGQASGSSLDITVVQDPQASILYASGSVDANVSVMFRSSGSGGIGPYSYEWIVAGQTFYNTTLSFLFSDPGNYTVQLIIGDSFGIDATSSVIIEVHPDPAVNVTWSGSPTVSEEFPLLASVSGGIGPYSISWIFPSGQHETGTSVSNVFEESGPETFQVQVFDQGGFSGTFNYTIVVNLYVSVESNVTSGQGPLAVQFYSEVLGGSGYAYNWSFGNGHYSLEQNPSYDFQVGNYTVTFTVTAANGATGSKTIRIESLPAPVLLEYSTGLNITQEFSFRAIPNWDASGPYSMSWSFPNGQTVTGMNITYVFPVYSELNTVIATFTYSGGTWQQYLTVRMVPAAPLIQFSPPSVIPVDTMLSLNATSSAPDSSSFTYSWTINGSVESGSSVLYYFSHTGIYNVSVTVTDSLGASSTITRTIQVLTAGSNASIVITNAQKSIGPDTYYTIRVQSSNGITAVEAFMGSSLLSPTEVNSTYTPDGEVAYFNLTMNQLSYNAGSYAIKIVVFNNASQSNSVTMSFEVSSQYSGSSFSLGTIISDFGGIGNFAVIVTMVAGVVIAWDQLNRSNKPPEIVVSSGGKSKTYQLDAKRVKK